MSDPNNIKPTERYRTAPAERGKFWEVDEDYLASLGYPASGEGKYAVLTYMVNPISVAISGGDIQIGAVEIKDADTDIRTNVVELTAGYNAVATLIVDADGNQITDFGGDTSLLATELTLVNVLTGIQSIDVDTSLLATESTLGDVLTGIQAIETNTGDISSTIQYVAVSGEPTEVADGATIEAWADTFGRPVVKGYNSSVDAIDANLVNQADLNRLGPVTMLNGVGTTGASSSTDISSYHNYTVHINCTGATLSGAVVTVEHSLDDSYWATLSTVTVSASGVTEWAESQVAYKYLRTNIITYLDGTITTSLYAGN